MLASCCFTLASMLKQQLLLQDCVVFDQDEEKAQCGLIGGVHVWVIACIPPAVAFLSD